jgi:hypothetical protein
MLASFDCNGNHRWSKMFGGNAGDLALGLTVDNDGSVYVATFIYTYQQPTPGHISTDVTLTATGKAFYLIKYNTAGVYQWHRTPQADTVTPWSHSNSNIMSLITDEQNNVQVFAHLAQGEYGGVGGYSVITPGEYILKYAPDGTFLGGTKLDMNIMSPPATRFVELQYNKRNGRYYVAGRLSPGIETIKIGSTTLTKTSYMACFKGTGQLEWLEEGDADAGINNRFVIDGQSNIYVTGGCKPGGIWAGHTFNGTGIYPRPMVVKMDSTGKSIWAVQGIDDVGAVTGGVTITRRNSGELVMAGAYAIRMGWPRLNKQFEMPPNSGYRTFTTRINTHTGYVLDMDTISSVGVTTPNIILSDNKNSVYLGGYFMGKVKVGSTPQLSTTGGNSDWYIGRYGYTCGCKEVPEPKFSYTVSNGSTVTMNYTGTTYTGIKWDFGDGTTDNTASPSHTFPANSFQTVCVTVTNNCGDNVYCENIPLWPTGVNEVNATDGITLYPNPAQSQLTIKGATAGAQIRVFSIIGKQLLQTTTTTNDAIIDVAQLPPGSYLLHINTAGNTSTKQFIKE